MGNWASAKRRDWAERSGGIGRARSGGIGNGELGEREAEGLGGAKRRDWAERSGGIGNEELEMGNGEWGIGRSEAEGLEMGNW